MSLTQGYYCHPQNRWKGIGPYYAMFPTNFADEVIRKYTNIGEYIIDPFAGRGTSLFSAAVNDRIGVGVELNPVGWVYSKAKLNPANKDKVIDRLKVISKSSRDFGRQIRDLPEFFHICFDKKVLKFISCARADLNWRRSRVDQTIAAIMLVYLHGKVGASLSNQLRQTKSMAPQYAIKWWKDNKLKPISIDPLEFLIEKINWRYEKGIPELTRSYSYLGDSRIVLNKLLKADFGKNVSGKIKLLLTSPPYCGVTNYHYDQWLRLWLLGFPYVEESGFGSSKKRYSNREFYRDLLLRVFELSSKWLSRDAIIYVRTDAREYTLKTTKEILKKTFPQKRLLAIKRPINKPSQTALFGDFEQKKGEVDIILR